MAKVYYSSLEETISNQIIMMMARRSSAGVETAILVFGFSCYNLALIMIENICLM